MSEVEFRGFPKVTRLLEQEIVVTEKIDGTNGLVFVSAEDLSVVKAGSRNKWVTPDDDNHGFAKWVEENKEDLKNLGHGYHYGEWWGQGIQRRYNMDTKVFSLFHVPKGAKKPECCDVVPVLYKGILNPEWLDNIQRGISFSHAAAKYGKHFADPEGVMVYFTKSKQLYKVPKEKGHKGE